MEIRLINISDYDAIYDLWKRTEGVGLRSIDDSKEGIEKFIKRNPTSNFVCLIDEKIVATILCGHDGRRAYIYHATVDATYRKKGIGRSLVEHVVKALKDEDINKIALIVYGKNTLGNAFWEELSFKQRKDLVYRDRSINNLNI